MFITNGTLWKDTSGQPVHAHGGSMIRVDGFYYWFGENRSGRKRVSCYRSANLRDWEFRGDVLTLDSPFRPMDIRTDPKLASGDESGTGANIERPKVVHNPVTGQYVMWMHWENGRDYHAARCAVATCDTVDGDYVYRGSFNPAGHMSRDCTLFVDDDGTAYFISAARDNADLHIYRLSEDFLSIDEHVKTLWPGQYREAPAMLKRNGVYFLITSGCTGWEPNQGKYAYADRITGRWSRLYDLGGPTTYDTQPAFVLPIHGAETTSYLYIGDRWDPSDYHRSSYAALPLEFPDDRTLVLHWADAVHIDLHSGRVETRRKQSGLWRIRNGSHRYLTPGGEGDNRIAARRLSYASLSQLWVLEPADGGFVRIQNRACGRYLEPQQHNGAAEVALAERSDRTSQQWRIVEEEKAGWCIIRNRLTGNVLTWNRNADGILHEEALRSDRDGRHAQRFLLTEHYGELPAM
jgi:hypothetical protein